MNGGPCVMYNSRLPLPCLFARAGGLPVLIHCRTACGAATSPHSASCIPHHVGHGLHVPVTGLHVALPPVLSAWVIQKCRLQHPSYTAQHIGARLGQCRALSSDIVKLHQTGCYTDHIRRHTAGVLPHGPNLNCRSKTDRASLDRHARSRHMLQQQNTLHRPPTRSRQETQITRGTVCILHHYISTEHETVPCCCFCHGQPRHPHQD